MAAGRRPAPSDLTMSTTSERKTRMPIFMNKTTTIRCPSCSKKTELLGNDATRIYNGICARCNILIYSKDKDLAWVGNVEKHWYTFWRKEPIFLPPPPFQLHLRIRDLDASRAKNMIDHVFKDLKGTLGWE
jgi:hypothetical protein